MNNLIIFKDADNLNKIFEQMRDKLIIIMLFSKSNPQCRTARNSFEKSAINHITSIFCIVDMDHFEGESKLVSNSFNLPHFSIYYMGNQLGSFNEVEPREIEIKSGEQYVITQNNLKNISLNQPQMNQPQMNPIVNMMQPINPQQVRQDIINNFMTTNPMMGQQFMNNPTMLNQIVQNRVLQLQQQQLLQQQMLQQQMQNNIMMNQGMTTQPIQSQISPTQLQTPTITNNSLPSSEQVQQLFKIFQMMQQMGLMQQSNTISENQNQSDDKIITLSNGDKLVPLSDGKYGLIKKK